MSILRIRDASGEFVAVPAIRGEKGEKGDRGEPGGVTAVNGIAPDVSGNVRLQWPVNLLDNSDFRNPVNQRGQSSYSGIWVYAIDRWIAWQDESSPATVTVQSGGIATYPGAVVQRIESKYIDSSKTYTLAAMTGDGLMVLSGKITAASQGVTNTNNGIYFEYNVDSDTYQFILVGLTSTSKFVWAALYEGSYTADTLPPYVPKGYGAELAECQRYLMPLRGRITCVALSDNGMLCDIFSNIAMAGNRNPGLIGTRIAADIVGIGTQGITLNLAINTDYTHSIEMMVDQAVLTPKSAYSVDFPSGVFIEEEL